MKLLLFHPGVSSFSCQECKEFLYDFATGQRKTYRAGKERKELPMLRPKNVPTPCEKCPRESPAKADEYELSERNYRTLVLFQRARATNFLFLTEEEVKDPLLARNFAVLDKMYREFERQRQTEELTSNLLAFMPQGR